MDTSIDFCKQGASFADIWTHRTPRELHELAHVKRFMECLVGDSQFRDKLVANITNPRLVVDEYKIDVDPDLMLPLFRADFSDRRFAHADDRWPLAKEWDRYIVEMITHRNAMIHAGETKLSNPRFHAWRQRQIARLKSELGNKSLGIVHPIISYELSKGCTVGCWFCGISAKQFEGYFPYTNENESLWRAMLGVVADRFGPAARTGFCYWATDPSDNPDYVKFLRSHHEILGFVPQTTTAAPLRNLAQTREILELFARHRSILNRFSILSVGQLRRVHATFSADELLGVELVLQNASALTSKSMAGRARLRARKHAGTHPELAVTADPPAQLVPGSYNSEGTIACVSGFLVSMIDRRIQLVSPTRACENWPDGYRIYDEARFNSAEDFGGVLDRMIARHMAPSLVPHDKLAFRPDLIHESQSDGFIIRNQSSNTTIQGAPWVRMLGESVQGAGRTVADTIAEACLKGADIFAVTDCLDKMYQSGLFHDDPVYGSVGRALVNEMSV